MGWAEVVNGLGGMIGAVAGGVCALPGSSFTGGDADEEVDGCEEWVSLQEQSDRSLLAVAGGEGMEEFGEVSPELSVIGELRDMALVRKSVYADGGLMGVLRKSGSGLMLKLKATAERGVAVVAVLADVISEGKVAETGVASLPSFGFLSAGMMKDGVEVVP
jgi:hypothetical protein